VKNIKLHQLSKGIITWVGISGQRLHFKLKKVSKNRTIKKNKIQSLHETKIIDSYLDIPVVFIALKGTGPYFKTNSKQFFIKDQPIIEEDNTS